MNAEEISEWCLRSQFSPTRLRIGVISPEGIDKTPSELHGQLQPASSINFMLTRSLKLVVSVSGSLLGIVVLSQSPFQTAGSN
jgi:hypothetical protein